MRKQGKKTLVLSYFLSYTNSGFFC